MALARPTFHLLASAVNPRTHQTYVSAVVGFCEWVLDAGEAADGWDEIDILLTAYFEHLFDVGRPRQQAVNAVSGLCHLFPSCTPYLVTARRSLQGWSRLAPTGSYPPMAWPVACGVAWKLLVTGRLSSSLAVLLAQDCYLRRGEVAALLVQDFRFDSHRAVVCLSETKTGRSLSVEIRHSQLADALRSLCVGRNATDRVFCSAQTLHAHFSDGVRMLGVSGRGYVFHSLRHGGATDDYHRLVASPETAVGAVAYVKERGRWVADASCRRYLQQARFLSLRAAAPVDVSELCNMASLIFFDVCRLLSLQSV